MLSAIRSPAFSPSACNATAHLTVSSSNRRAARGSCPPARRAPPSADMSHRSPSKISAASSPWPASTWRSTSLKHAFVRPPTNQRQCGGSARRTLASRAQSPAPAPGPPARRKPRPSRTSRQPPSRASHAPACQPAHEPMDRTRRDLAVERSGVRDTRRALRLPVGGGPDRIELRRTIRPRRARAAGSGRHPGSSPIGPMFASTKVQAQFLPARNQRRVDAPIASRVRMREVGDGLGQQLGKRRLKLGFAERLGQPRDVLGSASLLGIAGNHAAPAGPVRSRAATRAPSPSCPASDDRSPAIRDACVATISRASPPDLPRRRSSPSSSSISPGARTHELLVVDQQRHAACTAGRAADLAACARWLTGSLLIGSSMSHRVPEPRRALDRQAAARAATPAHAPSTGRARCPLPTPLVEKNGSTARASVASSMPMPVSATDRSMHGVGAGPLSVRGKRRGYARKSRSRRRRASRRANSRTG